jgi:alpha/beta superfamily hydrolase
MRASTRRQFVAGPAGRIECAVDLPGRAAGEGAGPVRGAALVAHPHPLHGGTLDNKVVQTLARALVELGYAAWRPNFRGVGGSDGSYDAGRGEVEDLAAVLETALGEHGRAPPVLAGFSFGAAAQARLAERLAKEGKPLGRMVLVGVAVNHFSAPPVPGDTIVIHGERDETVPLGDVLAWAAPQELPVVVVPGADHFFHRRLHVLRAIVRHSWR